MNIKKDMDRAVSKELRKASLRILRGVIVRTPVDSGRLRGAWLVGVNMEPIGPGDPSKQTSPVVIREGAILRQVTEADDKITIINNLPYAQPIEDGHGGRTPGVMIANTLAVERNRKT